MRSDVAVGGMLSGGMDSSSIVSVVGSDFPALPFKTFTIYYEGPGQMDERAWAREVPARYSNLDPIYYAPSDREVAGCFDAASKAHEVPLRASLAISGYFVMKLAAESNVKVVLDGTGRMRICPIGRHMTDLSVARSKEEIAKSAKFASRRSP